MSPRKGSFADSWLSFLTHWGVFSLTERTEFTELLAHSLSPQNAFGIQSSQRPFN